MLTHLRLSGTLTGVRGVIAGHFGEGWEQAIRDNGSAGSAKTDGEAAGGEAGDIAAAGVAAGWHRETVLALPGPVATGLACGHGTPNLTLPLGAHGVLDASHSELVIDVSR